MMGEEGLSSIMAFYYNLQFSYKCILRQGLIHYSLPQVETTKSRHLRTKQYLHTVLILKAGNTAVTWFLAKSQSSHCTISRQMTRVPATCA